MGRALKVLFIERAAGHAIAIIKKGKGLIVEEIIKRVNVVVIINTGSFKTLRPRSS